MKKTYVNFGSYPKDYPFRLADVKSLLIKLPHEVMLLRSTNSLDWHSRVSTIKRLTKELFDSLLGDRSEKHLSEFDDLLVTQIPNGSHNTKEYIAIILCKCLYAILEAEKAYTVTLFPDLTLRGFSKHYVEKVNATNSWERLT